MPDNRLIMPTFTQAGAFARSVGISTDTDWQDYIKGMSREDLFQRILSIVAGCTIAPELED